MNSLNTQQSGMIGNSVIGSNGTNRKWCDYLFSKTYLSLCRNDTR